MKNDDSEITNISCKRYLEISKIYSNFIFVLQFKKYALSL